mgnify:CR=1 FL=1
MGELLPPYEDRLGRYGSVHGNRDAFLIAFAVVGAVSFRKIAHTNRAVLKYASVLGLLLFGLFAFLTHGLETTSASNGGFLTAMAVVFVPVINAALQRRMPPRPIIAGTW